MRAIGEKAEKFMKRKIKYTDESFENFKRVKDFLPPPEKLVMKQKDVQLTLSLNETSVNFFKKIARKQGTSSVAMIRNLIDSYVQHYTS